jgi:hypothetical protein
MGCGGWRNKHAGCAEAFTLLASLEAISVAAHLTGVLEDIFDTTRAADCALWVATLCVGVRRRCCFASLRAAWALM